jgi:hypothetical protein
VKNDLALRPPVTFLVREGGDIAVKNPAPQFCSVCLKRDQVVRLEKSSGIQSIEVKTGVLWLTSTPASGDVILQAGKTFELKDQWPYVIEALQESLLSYFAVCASE